MWIFHTVSNTSPRCQVQNSIKSLSLQKRETSARDSNVHLYKLKAIKTCKRLESMQLQFHIIVFVEVVDPTTRSPRFRSPSTTREPINPAQPVTRYVPRINPYFPDMTFSCSSKSYFVFLAVPFRQAISDPVRCRTIPEFWTLSDLVISF